MTVVACPPSTPVTRGLVVFNATEFKAAYPEFNAAAFTDPILTNNFNLAALQLNKGCGSRVCDADERQTLLYLLTAHITQLRNGTATSPPSGLVGRIEQAREGTVDVTAAMEAQTWNESYYAQTQFGALYWQSTARYRTFVYVPAPAVCADFAGLGPRGFGGWPGNDPGCGC